MENLQQLRKSRPTKRAPNAGDSAPFSGIFHAPAFSTSGGVPPSAPAQVTHTVWQQNEKESIACKKKHFVERFRDVNDWMLGLMVTELVFAQ